MGAYLDITYQNTSLEDAHLLDSTDLEFLITFEAMAGARTPPLMQDEFRKDDDMTPVSGITSLPTPKNKNEEIEDHCFIYGRSAYDDGRDNLIPPPAPALKDLSTFDGSGVGDFDNISIHYDEEDGADNSADSFEPYLQCLPQMDVQANISSWLENQQDDDSHYLTAGCYESAGDNDVGTRTKRTRSVALSDDVEERRSHPRPNCMLGLTDIYPPRHMPPD